MALVLFNVDSSGQEARFASGEMGHGFVEWRTRCRHLQETFGNSKLGRTPMVLFIGKVSFKMLVP